MKALFTVLTLLVVCACTFGQSKKIETASRVSSVSLRRARYIIPSALVISVTVVMLDTDADEFFLSNFEVREERNENFINFFESPR